MSIIQIPDQIDAGDTLQFDAAPADYPPTDGWTMKLRARLRTGTNEFTLTAATGTGTSTGGYTFTATPAQTANYAAGTYGWASWVEKTGAQVTLERGQVVVLASAQNFTGDTRHPDEIALEAIQACLGGIATVGQQRYMIGDRELWKFPMSELLSLQSYFAGRVQRLYGLKTRTYVRIANA